jgi:hypothetical protein
MKNFHHKYYLTIHTNNVILVYEIVVVLPSGREQLTNLFVGFDFCCAAFSISRNNNSLVHYEPPYNSSSEFDPDEFLILLILQMILEKGEIWHTCLSENTMPKMEN